MLNNINRIILECLQVHNLKNENVIYNNDIEYFYINLTFLL